MGKSLPHEEFRIALAAEALEALADTEREELLAHMGECPACADERAELRRLARTLDDAVPPAQLDPERAARIRERLLGRAASDAGTSVLPLRPPTRRVPRWVTTGSGWLVAAGLASLLLTHHSFHRPLSVGWVMAAALGVALFCLGIYAARQHHEVQALRGRLAEKEGAVHQ